MWKYESIIISKNAVTRSSKKRSFSSHSYKILQNIVGYCKNLAGNNIPARFLQYPTRYHKISQDLGMQEKDLFLEDLARAFLLGYQHTSITGLHAYKYWQSHAVSKNIKDSVL